MTVSNDQLMAEIKELREQVGNLNQWRYEMQRLNDQHDRILHDHDKQIERLLVMVERNTQALSEIKQGISTIGKTIYIVCAMLAGLAGLVVIINGFN